MTEQFSLMQYLSTMRTLPTTIDIIRMREAFDLEEENYKPALRVSSAGQTNAFLHFIVDLTTLSRPSKRRDMFTQKEPSIVRRVISMRNFCSTCVAYEVLSPSSALNRFKRFSDLYLKNVQFLHLLTVLQNNIRTAQLRRSTKLVRVREQ